MELLMCFDGMLHLGLAQCMTVRFVLGSEFMSVEHCDHVHGMVCHPTAGVWRRHGPGILWDCEDFSHPSHTAVGCQAGGRG